MVDTVEVMVMDTVMVVLIGMVEVVSHFHLKAEDFFLGALRHDAASFYLLIYC